jgi:hypothetical protein
MAAETPIAFDHPSDRFITYCNLQFGAGTVTGCSVQGPNDPNMASEISFGPNVSAATQASVLNIAQNTPSTFGGWAPIALPDLEGFLHDVVTDPNAPQFPLALVMCIALASPSLSYTDRKNFASTAATWVRNAYPSQANAVLAAINTYATNRWVPLT